MNKTEVLKRANQLSKNTLMETLRIEFTDFGEDFIEAVMPVGPLVHQPAGLLHGGATAALAESIGSCGSHLILNDPDKGVVGIEINANHIRSVRRGKVIGRGKLIHKGSRTHVWEIKVNSEDGKLISTCRLTNMIISSR